MPLTDLAIRNAKPKDKPYKISDSGGLFLWIQANGGKWWRYQYRFGGKRKLLALGVYPEVSLAEARENHLKARKMLASGVDPSGAKKEIKRLAIIKSINTFEAIAREWHQTRLNNWSGNYAGKVMTSMEQDVFPQI